MTHLKGFCNILLLFLVFAQVPASGLDCRRCIALNDEIINLKKEKQEASFEIAQQKELLKTLTAEDDSKRMRLTAHLFVLAARAEAAENFYLHKEKDLKQNCNVCKKLK